MKCPEFLVVTDLNYVTRAIGRRYIRTVTLVDAGVSTGRPLVDITLIDGDIFRSVMIPGPGGSSAPYADTQRAIELFFDGLAGKENDNG